MSTDSARKKYSEIFERWNKHRCSIFPCKQLSINEWTKDVWVLVGAEGVAIHEIGKDVPLMNIAYSSIYSFGAPQANRYKIVVASKGEIEFDSDYVTEISQLMRFYIKALTERVN